MTILRQVVVTLLVFLRCFIQGSGDLVALVDHLTRCNQQRYDEYDKKLDDVLNAIGQRADEHHGLGFNTYYSSSSSSSHGHGCCHPALIERDCSRCIPVALGEIRQREVRYEKYDMDDDYSSCSRY